MPLMPGQAAPLPGVAYPTGTMSSADIYPTHVGIGGITTQDRALPAFAEASAAAARPGGQIEQGLLGQPAGYLFLAILAILVLTWVRR